MASTYGKRYIFQAPAWRLTNGILARLEALHLPGIETVPRLASKLLWAGPKAQMKAVLFSPNIPSFISSAILPLYRKKRGVQISFY